MSRSLARLARITLPFEGTPEQRSKNQASHTWRVIDMEERYGVRGLPKTTECQRCKVIAETIAADWPCGMAPSPLTLDEYIYMVKNRKRRS